MSDETKKEKSVEEHLFGGLDERLKKIEAEAARKSDVEAVKTGLDGLIVKIGNFFDPKPENPKSENSEVGFKFPECPL